MSDDPARIGDLRTLLRRQMQAAVAMYVAARRQLAAELDWIRQRYPDAERREDHGSLTREEDR